jgi:ADP-ribose pyrophosphatase
MAELEIELLGEEIHGGESGFLRVRRLHLRNRSPDGTLSPHYVCDFAIRPKGADAVVVALWRRRGASVEVLLRTGLRPALWHGRSPEQLPIADAERSPWMIEVVAGIIERADRGETGVRERAAIEAWEEAGLRIDAARVEFLGAGTFPTPGSMPEKFWLVAAEIDPGTEAELPPGDGSPMEQGARTHWRELDAAIGACVSGEIADAKTELVLRRLRDRLAPHIREITTSSR